jgi:circadian clock protein KaiC
MSETIPERLRERVTTGVPGLDAVLEGGFLRRAVYMLQGRPGAGKTILSNQICFHHAAQGGRVLYVTLLSETHERMIFNLEQLGFFDPVRIPDRLSYVSGYAVMEEAGLKGLSDMLRHEARSAKATLLVVDGLVAIEETTTTAKQFKKFIHELQVHAAFLGCTVLLLSSANAEPIGPEHTMVDGVLRLSDNRVQKRREREIEVSKFRGSNYLKGGHAFQITDAGIAVYPRLEALLKNPNALDTSDTHRLPVGIAGLDKALGGGIRAASSTVMFGPTGGGKTTLGLHFLNESSEAQPGLHFGFYETPPRLLFKASALGLDLEEKYRRGWVDFIWSPTTERVLDVLGAQLLAAVRERHVKRLFVDGLEGFLESAPDPERIKHFMTALTNELRVLGVTTIYTSELRELFSETVTLPVEGVSSIVENILLARLVERGAQLQRTLTIVKLRDSGYDSSVRELLISNHGASLGDAIASDVPARSSSDQGTARASVGRLKRLLRRRKFSS